MDQHARPALTRTRIPLRSGQSGTYRVGAEKQEEKQESRPNRVQTCMYHGAALILLAFLFSCPPDGSLGPSSSWGSGLVWSWGCVPKGGCEKTRGGKTLCGAVDHKAKGGHAQSNLADPLRFKTWPPTWSHTDSQSSNAHGSI